MQERPGGSAKVKSLVDNGTWARNLGLSLQALHLLYHSGQRPKGELGKEVKIQKIELLLWRSAIITEGNCPSRRWKGGSDFPECFHGNILYCHGSVQIIYHNKKQRNFPSPKNLSKLLSFRTRSFLQ